MMYRFVPASRKGNAAVSRTCRALVAASVLALCVVGSAAPDDSYSSPYADAVLADDPTGFWRLDEAAGSTVAEDSSAHELDGLYRANVTPGAPGAIESDEDTAANFTATFDTPYVDQVDLPVTEPVSLGSPFTVEAWIRTDTTLGTVIGGDDGWADTPPLWSVQVKEDGRLGVTSFDGRWRYEATGPAVPLADDQWHHVVVVFSSARTLYVDGVRSTEPELRWPYVPPQVPPGEPEEPSGVAIGDVVGGAPFFGQIDDVSVYRYELSEAQIAAHRSAAWPGDTAADDATLTPAERDQAVAIATSDPRVVELLGGRVPVAEPVSVWTTLSGATKLGAQVTLAWTGAAALSYAWSFVLYDESEVSSPPYSESSAYSSAEGVTELDVTVDLVRGVVVQIQPDGEEISESEGGASSQFAPAATELLDPAMTGDTGGTTKRLRRITNRLVPGVGNDWFWNFDFDLGQDNVCIEHETALKCRPRPGKVDWPINVIFDNSADTYKAKVWGGGGGPIPDDGFITSKMWARVYDNPGAVGSDPRGYPPRPTPAWDSDQGSSLGGVGCYATKWHLRVYAPSEAAGGDERMFNLNWGFYVIGSTHRDYHELCRNGSAYSGDSELAERKLRTTITAEKGWQLEPNSVNLRNRMDAKVNRKHWDSNGMATVVHVP